MERQQIASTSIRSVGYDERSMVLELEFQNGHVYQYYDVPPEHFEAMVGPGSAGAYFNRVIRPNFASSQA